MTTSHSNLFKRDCVKAALASCVTSSLIRYFPDMIKDPEMIVHKGKGLCIDYTTLLIDLSKHLGLKVQRSSAISSAEDICQSGAAGVFSAAGTIFKKANLSALNFVITPLISSLSSNLMIGGHQFVIFDFSQDDPKRPFWTFEPMYGSYYNRSFTSSSHYHPDAGFLFYDANLSPYRIHWSFHIFFTSSTNCSKAFPQPS